MTINPNILASHHAGVVGVINPASLAVGPASTAWISMADFERLMAIVKVGVFGLNGTLDAKLEQATDAAGTGAKDIVGKAITQLTDAGVDDNKQAIINLSADELDVDGLFTHVRLTVTIGVIASLADAVVLGLVPRYGPASDHDLLSVDEIVS